MSRNNDDDVPVMRRAPRLWEQQLTDSLRAANPGGLTGAGGPIYDGVLDGEQPSDPDTAVPTDLPTPSTPTWSSTVAMLAVRWDGLDSAGDEWPMWTSWVECHVSPTPNFTPTLDTMRGAYTQGAGSIAVTALKSDTDYWLRLVGRDELGGETSSPEVKAHTGLIMDTDIGKGSITADKVSFNAREIGGITTGIGDALPTDADKGDLFLLKVRNPDGGVQALKQYQFDGAKWNSVEWGADAISAKAITAIQIAAGAVTAEAIAARAIVAENIATGTITAESGVIGSLDADKITTGQLSGDRVVGGTIVGANLRTPRGDDGTQIIVGQDNVGERSDYIKFYKNNDIKGQIRGQDDGLYIYGGGASQPIVLTGQAGTQMENIDVVDFDESKHNVLGLNKQNRVVQFKTAPKVGVSSTQNVDDLQALVARLAQQVQDLTGRITALEAPGE